MFGLAFIMVGTGLVIALVMFLGEVATGKREESGRRIAERKLV